eukprot:COSAG03_NODE_399_length_8210_cov_10.284483_5_plen_187_part_00
MYEKSLSSNDCKLSLEAETAMRVRQWGREAHCWVAVLPRHNSGRASGEAGVQPPVKHEHFRLEWSAVGCAQQVVEALEAVGCERARERERVREPESQRARDFKESEIMRFEESGEDFVVPRRGLPADHGHALSHSLSRSACTHRPAADIYRRACKYTPILLAIAAALLGQEVPRCGWVTGGRLSGG